MRDATIEESALLRCFIGHIRAEYETIREGRPAEALKYEWTTTICSIPVRLHFYSREYRLGTTDTFQLMTPGFRFSGPRAGRDRTHPDKLIIHSTDELFDHEMLAIKMAI